MRLAKFNRYTVKAADTIISALLGVIFLFTVTNVFSRYVLNYSFGWADELSRFLFVWMGFLGTATAFADNQHVALDLAVNRLPSRVRRIISILVLLGCILIFLLFLQQGWVLVRNTINRSPAVGIPMSVVYFCVPLASLLGVIYGIEKVIADVHGDSSEKRSEV